MHNLSSEGTTTSKVPFSCQTRATDWIVTATLPRKVLSDTCNYSFGGVHQAKT